LILKRRSLHHRSALWSGTEPRAERLRLASDPKGFVPRHWRTRDRAARAGMARVQPE